MGRAKKPLSDYDPSSPDDMKRLKKNEYCRTRYNNLDADKKIAVQKKNREYAKAYYEKKRAEKKLAANLSKGTVIKDVQSFETNVECGKGIDKYQVNECQNVIVVGSVEAVNNTHQNDVPRCIKESEIDVDCLVDNAGDVEAPLINPAVMGEKNKVDVESNDGLFEGSSSMITDDVEIPGKLHPTAMDIWRRLAERMNCPIQAYSGYSWTKICTYCGTNLMAGENASFCCNNGKNILPRLPPLPEAIALLYDQQGISAESRKLNHLFSFTSLGVHGQFMTLPTPSSVAMMGRSYHQILPVSKPNQPLHWYIYDESGRYSDANEHHVPVQWVLQLGAMLDAVNPFCKFINKVKDLRLSTATLSVNGEIATNDVAAIVHANNTLSLDSRIAVFWLHNQEQPVYMNILDAHYEPLQYPLLFPHGTLGWYPYNELGLSQIAWYRSRILHEPRFLQLGRLTCEYLVDMYSRVEDERLNFLSTQGYKKSAINVEEDFAEDEEVSVNNPGLPSSFLGSRRWCSCKIADALALTRNKGQPSLFITMTTNPHWPEIQSQLHHTQTAAEVPSVVVRSFHLRLQRLKGLLRDYFGTIVYMLHVIEFQKRGLPHVHLVVKVSPDIPLEAIQMFISAELPDDALFAIQVEKYMVHQHSHRCQKDSKCIWGYPKPLNAYTHLNEKGYVQYVRRTDKDTNIVPYSPFLLKQLDCHINIDVAATVHIFVYLYTYLYKGFDKVEYRIDRNPREPKDIDGYINARYLSSTEGTWRIFQFHMTEMQPAVKCLPLHLEAGFSRQYSSRTTASTLDRYFLRPLDDQFSKLMYVDYNEMYVMQPIKAARHSPDEYFEQEKLGVTQNIVRRRARGELICRIRLVLPHNGEIFYLRQLLLHSSPRSWVDLTYFNGQRYNSYQETVNAMGLLNDTSEPIMVMEEAISYLQAPCQLRFLFSLLILDGAPAVELWEKFRYNLIADFMEIAVPNSILAEQQALLAIENILVQHGTTGITFGLPAIVVHSKLSLEEHLKFPDWESYLHNASEMKNSMNMGQRHVYNTVTNMLNEHKDSIHYPVFIDGKAGSGKTYVLNGICYFIRGHRSIVLPCATTGLSAQLYRGGRTAHSLFQIPVTDNNIGVHSLINGLSQKADLLREAAAIIWDEFPMANKAVIESVDALLQRLLANDSPFGGKCIIAAGDFRQIAPIVEGAGRSATLDASIKSSELWQHFRVYRLEESVRNAADHELLNTVTRIGEDWEHDTVNLTLFETTNSMSYTRDFLFPPHILSNPSACEKRAFLSPLNVHVDEFNVSILDRLSGVEEKYYSYDSITENEPTRKGQLLNDPDFLHAYVHSTLPSHVLRIKQGAICQIMKLLDKERGLVKNARVIIHACYKKFVTVRLLGVDERTPAYIHPISRCDFFHAPQNCAFTIHRKQLPLRLAYSTTFHSCLGLTLDKIVLDLRTPVFAHGQLYTALTRIRKREDAIILHNSTAPTVTTRNVVFRELLQ